MSILTKWTTLATPALLLACSLTGSADEFGDYWYQGQAEITSYDLEQARYGEVHDGHAVLIFVTEDFSESKHVKLDKAGGSDAVTVLKLNATRKFNTGIYPYSMMTSVFTPVSADRYPSTLKVNTSSQEWCGHTFTQLNLDDDGYRAKLYSYFERESDRDIHLENVILEDELWNRIRLSPAALPTGELHIIPGTIFQRLSHNAWGAHTASAIFTADPTDPALQVYQLTYADIRRTLTIRFRKTFPHEIESWTERARGRGPDAPELVTRATRKKRIQLDYWRRHDVADSHYREQLGLK